MKIFINLSLLLLISLSVIAQDKVQISGTVTDQETRTPLIGVSISVKNSPGFGTVSDEKGRYSIQVSQFDRLVFTYIGYDSVEVLVKEQRNIDVVMKQKESKVMDEVVITATGPQKKITLTGAVTSVDMEDLKRSAPTSSIANAFAGRVAGILARQTSGKPGQNISDFWIRGISTFGANKEAYVLVDGFERNLNEINIEDIKSISVLKDASATAIYGSKGANGVILITTKHGKAGKIQIHGKVETAYKTRTITPEFEDGYSYAKLLNEARITRSQEPIYTPVELEIFRLKLDPDLYPNVDWKDKLLKDGAMTYRANINMSGGGNTARYFVSGSFIDEKGMYNSDKALENDYNTNADFKRWNYRLNTDVNITKSTLLKLGVAGSLSKRNSPGLGDDWIWDELFGYTPIRTPILYSNGYVPAIGTGNQTNPWVTSTQTGFNENWRNNIQTNVTLDQNFDFLLKGLHFVGRFGYDTYNSSNILRRKWPMQWIAERRRDEEGNLIFKKISDASEMHQTSSSTGQRREFLDVMFNYHHLFKKHRVGLTVKYTQDALVHTQNLGGDLKTGMPRRNQGLAGQIRYNWNYRYFLSFNFGYTGSENFAIGHQFGFFPAVSGAWNIGEEEFIKEHVNWIDMFKIRFSYGKVGNDRLGGDRFPYLYTIAGGLDGYEWAEFGISKSFAGRGFTQVASPYVTWEVSTKKDLGLDVSIFNDDVTFTIDYFDERRDGIYMARNFLPEMVGLESVPKANVGAVRSQGIDGHFTINHKFGKVSLTMRGNMTYGKNEILDRDEEYSVYPYQMAEGYRVAQTRGLIALGLFKDYDDIRNSPKQTFGPYQPGDIKYKDVNGDGVINGDDVVPIGSTSRPNFIYGLGFSVRWKGLDINWLFQGTGESSYFIFGKTVYAFSEGQWGNILKGMLDNRWVDNEISGKLGTENANASYPRLSYNRSGGNNYRNSSFWLRDGKYLRLKNLDIGYTLPRTFLNQFHIKSLRVFFVGSNLLTWAPFKLWDPEMGSSRGESYPPSKFFTVGLNISL